MSHLWLYSLKKEIIGASGYFITSDGNVFSFRHKNGYRKNPFLLNKSTFCGYLTVTIRLDSKKTKRAFVHRLIAEAFIPNPENKPQVNHKNGIRTDNSLKNLEWCTAKENCLHSTRVLKNGVGVKNGSAKLKDNDILQIRALSLKGFSQRQIAGKYNVAQTNIYHIVNNKTWKHINEEDQNVALL